MPALMSGALAGDGVAQFPILMLREELESGSLVRVLRDWQLPREVIHIAFSRRTSGWSAAG
jgi:DNA-binding transcriptional LysR family regulator